MLSREEMRQAERLASGEQDTRDEIGFLLIHQGFADRFFPGTSVLHTRVRYALFVPWLFLHAKDHMQRGRSLNGAIERELIQFAFRLKKGERYGVIGGDKLGQLTFSAAGPCLLDGVKAMGPAAAVGQLTLGSASAAAGFDPRRAARR